MEQFESHAPARHSDGEADPPKPADVAGPGMQVHAWPPKKSPTPGVPRPLVEPSTASPRPADSKTFTAELPSRPPPRVSKTRVLPQPAEEAPGPASASVKLVAICAGV